MTPRARSGRRWRRWRRRRERRRARRDARARDAGDGIVRPGYSGVFVRGENGEGFGVRKKCVGAR